MERLKIAILFGTEPNFDDDAFKYFILYVNQIQNTYEFFFPDNGNFVFTEKKTSKIEFNSCLQKVTDFVLSEKINADHFISIITNSFNNYYFFNASKECSVITTDVWDKQFSPPSLFEYLLHCIYTCLIYSQKKNPIFLIKI